MFQMLSEYLPKPLKALAIRFDKSPLATVEQVREFVQTRSSYVGQTSLYGYLKTRMGTRYRVMFEDDVFSQSIRIAAIKVFVSCLSDLSVFVAALTKTGSDLSDDEAATLAEYCFVNGMKAGLTEEDSKYVPEKAVELFQARLGETHWPNAALGENAFTQSPPDLVRYAPVIDEFKELDEEIVRNSIRFRWTDVRDQARKRVAAQDIAAEWRKNAHPFNV